MPNKTTSSPVILVITGHICTGKTYIAKQLENTFNYARIKTSHILREEAVRRRYDTDRFSLQQLGDQLDSESDHKWVLDYASEVIAQGHTSVVVDNLRTWKQLEHFRARRDASVIHAHLWAPQDELVKRFESRRQKDAAAKHDYADVDLIKNERDIQAFKSDADVRVNTRRTDGHDTVVRVAARIGLLPPPDSAVVDVIVGGQYGSEGKGHVAAYLARGYDVLMRVGGPNAGHTVLSDTGIHTYIHLPSGAKDTDAKILIGPGACIDPPVLL